MYNWLNKQGVISDKGYIFQRMDRFHYHYIEGYNILHINVEPGIKYEEISIPKNIHWNSPNDRELINEKKFEIIIKNIGDALTFMKVPYKFVLDQKRMVYSF